MVDETTYNELDRYFTGRMQGDERMAFGQRLHSDASLKTELDWIVNVTAAMKNSGRTVMKQHIAAAIAGVPANAVQKYKPAKNAASLWKKWWVWAVAVAVAVSVAVAAYAYMIRHSETMHEGDIMNELSPEHALTSDSAVPDSYLEEMRMPVPTDSALSKDSSKAIEGEVRVRYDIGDEMLRPVRIQEQNRPANNAERKVDSAVPVYGWQAPVVVSGGVQQGKEISMSTSIVPRKQPPYTYVLDQKLTLNANYTTTAGFRFRGYGDTVYMTDNNQQTFQLLRNKGEQPLVPLKAVSK